MDTVRADEFFESLSTDLTHAGELADVKWHEDLVDRLVDFRKKSSLTQEAVAEAMGTAQSVVSVLETASNDPRISTLLRYARAIGAEICGEVRPRAAGGGAGTCTFVDALHAHGTVKLRHTFSGWADVSALLQTEMNQPLQFSNPHVLARTYHTRLTAHESASGQIDEYYPLAIKELSTFA